jgi:hypothetical protein
MEKRKNVKHKEINLLPPVSSTRNITQKTPHKERKAVAQRIQKEILKESEASLHRQLLPFRMWIIMRVFYE